MTGDVNLRTSTLVVRLAMTGCAALGVVWAILGLVFEADAGPARRLAERIDDGASPDPSYFARFEERHDLDGLVASCGGDVAKDVVLIRLSAAEAAIRQGDGEAVEQALSEAAETLRAALRCAPLNGDAWLRLAMVEARRGGVSPEVVDMLRMSYWTTPNEISVMRPRIRFASALYANGIEEIAGELQGDIRGLVLWGHDGELEALVPAAPDAVAPFYEKAARLVSGRRRARIEPFFEERGFRLPPESAPEAASS